MNSVQRSTSSLATGDEKTPINIEDSQENLQVIIMKYCESIDPIFEFDETMTLAIINIVLYLAEEISKENILS